MHCAYLRNGDKWTRTNQHDAVLDHDGDCVICETPEDEAEVGLVFAERDPDKFVSKLHRNNDWIVTEEHFSSDPFDLSFMSEHKTAVVATCWNGIPNFTRHNHKDREYYVAGVNARSEQMVPGVIAEMYGDSMNLWKLTIDMEAWKVANNKVVRLRDRRDKRRAAANVTYNDIRSLGTGLVVAVTNHECLPRIKTDPTDSRIVILGITLADCVLGTDKTNGMIKDIAAKWIKNKAANTARFTDKKWLSAEHLEKLNLRFEQAVADLPKHA